jgi:Protein of unknown function (DUF2934)
MAEGPEKKAAKKAGAKKASSAKKGPAKKALGAKKGGAKKATGAKKAASSSPRAGRPSHDQISQAAYHRWEREGGDPVENWLEAERELSGD